jgi:hypothetical protein
VVWFLAGLVALAVASALGLLSESCERRRPWGEPLSPARSDAEADVSARRLRAAVAYAVLMGGCLVGAWFVARSLDDVSWVRGVLPRAALLFLPAQMLGGLVNVAAWGRGIPRFDRGERGD